MVETSLQRVWLMARNWKRCVRPLPVSWCPNRTCIRPPRSPLTFRGILLRRRQQSLIGPTFQGHLSKDETEHNFSSRMTISTAPCYTDDDFDQKNKLERTVLRNNSFLFLAVYLEQPSETTTNLKRGGDMSIFLDQSCNSTGGLIYHQQAWKVKQPSFLFFSATTSFVYSNVCNEIPRYPGTSSGKTNCTTWSINKRCPWLIWVLLQSEVWCY